MSAPTVPTPLTAAGAEAAALTPVDTQAVGFAVFDRVVLSVHPAGCSLLEGQRQKLLQAPPWDVTPRAACPASRRT